MPERHLLKKMGDYQPGLPVQGSYPVLVQGD